MKRIAFVSAVLAVASLTAGGASLAQGAPGGARVACAADLSKFCPSQQPGPDRRQCMMSHKDDLSAGCKAAIAAAMAAHQAGQPNGAPHP
jgi:hypothetical protein